MFGIKQHDSLGCLGRHILDVLGFIKNKTVELHVGEEFDVIPYQSISGQDDIIPGSFIQITVGAVVGVYLHERGEFAELSLPVEKKSAGHDYHRRLASLLPPGSSK